MEMQYAVLAWTDVECDMFSRLPYITPLNSHTNACNIPDALYYVPNNIMGLHDMLLATGTLWAGLIFA